MRHARTETHLVRRYADGASTRGPDDLIVEEPLSIRLDDTLVATTMRTPGHDFELAVGFCVTEGLLAGAPVQQVRYCATGSAVDTGFNVVSVQTGGLAPVPTPRLGPMTSSCGLCGSTELSELAERLAPLECEAFALDALAAMPVAARAHQPLFDATGAVHAAVAVDRGGGVVLAREDIGRHNAVDKVVGALALSGRLPASDLALFVSSRASFEMVTKAWAGGFAALVAVSAPSSLAVRAARAAGLQLAGFARDGRFNLYAPER